MRIAKFVCLMDAYYCLFPLTFSVPLAPQRVSGSQTIQLVGYWHRKRPTWAAISAIVSAITTHTHTHTATIPITFFFFFFQTA